MTSSYCLSSTRNVASSESLLRHRYRSSYTAKPCDDKPLFLKPRPHKAFLPLSTPRTTQGGCLLCTFAATVPAFADGKDEYEQGEVRGDEESQGMAHAFGISSSAASGISICIAFTALSFPLFMKSLGQGLALKTRAVSYATLLFGFYMAWNIGANDVANAMGTSVGSGALTLRQAVLMAAVLEFSGALLMGTHVSSTMQNGILIADVFKGKDGLLFAGLLSSLAAAGFWLQVASYFGWPVSTTHCIIGSMVGFGLVYGGTGAVFWSSLVRVMSSWLISPVIGALVSFFVYKCIRTFVYSAPNPGQAAVTAAPVAVFVGITCITFAAFPLSQSLPIALLQALACGMAGAFAVHRIIGKQLGHLLVQPQSGLLNSEEAREGPGPNKSSIGFLSTVSGPKGTQLELVYGVFGYMQVLSACFMSFAHGGNDVSNAIGPLAAALSILHGRGTSGAEIVIPTDVLAWGGFGIVAGLTMWGYRVISTIGKKITELTPTRGFAAEFAAASVVLFASKLGLPISATHTLVGAVMGVGFARGMKSVRTETVKEIVASWAVTIPVGAVLSVFFTWVLTKLLIL
ncbi:hypothetical protein MLD38_003214 [Melastoma candidum]|uniref:Uncharacterized protein n=1 Tax=Melastoma candidum TaxID=119954 RepID=A0ACB9S140_9MYRT|nr:hypothetical protein MLD38_003214 [Melastoma candidum]